MLPRAAASLAALLRSGASTCPHGGRAHIGTTCDGERKSQLRSLGVTRSHQTRSTRMLRSFARPRQRDGADAAQREKVCATKRTPAIGLSASSGSLPACRVAKNAKWGPPRWTIRLAPLDKGLFSRFFLLYHGHGRALGRFPAPRPRPGTPGGVKRGG